MYSKVVEAGAVEKVELGFVGVSVQMLTGDKQGNGLYTLTTMAPGAVVPAHSHTGADEFTFVVSGDFVEGGKTYGPGASFYGVAGTAHGPHSTRGGCVLLTHYSAPVDFVPAS